MPLFDLRDQMDHLLKVPPRFLQLMVGDRLIPGAKGLICLPGRFCRGRGRLRAHWLCRQQPKQKGYARRPSRSRAQLHRISGD
jgi:hypothetical protein